MCSSLCVLGYPSDYPSDLDRVTAAACWQSGWVGGARGGCWGAQELRDAEQCYAVVLSAVASALLSSQPAPAATPPQESPHHQPPGVSSHRQEASGAQQSGVAVRAPAEGDGATSKGGHPRLLEPYDVAASEAKAAAAAAQYTDGGHLGGRPQEGFEVWQLVSSGGQRVETAQPGDSSHTATACILISPASRIGQVL